MIQYAIYRDTNKIRYRTDEVRDQGGTMHVSATEWLAESLSDLGYDALPLPVVERARECVLDSIGCMLAGRDDAHVHHEVDAKPASASRARRETRTTRTSSKKSPSKSVRPTEARAEAPSREPAVEPAASVTPPPGLALDPRALSPRECKALLDAHGVRYEVTEGASDEHLYVRPKGPIGGVDYVFEGRRTVHEVMDCRLVVALLKLSPVLKREGVRRIRHLSVFRPDARVAQTGKRSGHASALAIDVRFLEFEDGRTLDVLADWGNRERGVMPCAEGVGASDPNPELRRITCEMIDAQIFQTVITPHRDQLHENHVHLELVPEVSWTFIR